MIKIKTTAERIDEFYSLMHPYISKEFYQWLIKNGFFTAPASRKFHGAYPGGLYDHCHAVTMSLVDMTEKLGLKWQKERSPYIVGMLHDLCKIDQYEKIIDVKGVEYFGMDEPQGEEFHYEYSKEILIPGHGDKSVMMLSEHMQLTEEEILCIRYHMGAYETKDWEYFDRAIKKYQTVLFTHTADMHASKVKGI